MRACLTPIFYLIFLGYGVFWLVVAFKSDPTWWWFVPIYGNYKIFGESVWWGLFSIAVFPIVIVGGILVGED